jgi:hypothetical protein
MKVQRSFQIRALSANHPSESSEDLQVMIVVNVSTKPLSATIYILSTQSTNSSRSVNFVNFFFSSPLSNTASYPNHKPSVLTTAMASNQILDQTNVKTHLKLYGESIVMSREPCSMLWAAFFLPASNTYRPPKRN